MSDVKTRLKGTTLVARIPMRLQHRGGRKRIVSPDGSAIVPTSRPQPDGTLVKALARAWRWRLDEEVHTSVSDIGEAGGISKSYVSQVAAAFPTHPAALVRRVRYRQLETGQPSRLPRRHRS